ncbi:MAG: peptidylprolyl isomerase [Myxococcota bacterium]|nr:peptidylprolyl isomerase [Myxococcota bacterium]
MRRTLPVLGILLVVAALACGQGADPAPAAQQTDPQDAKPESFVAEGPHETAVLEIEGLGVVLIQLLPELAPETVANFKKLAGEGYYDGTTFHRVIPGFMIQGGDPLTKNRDPRDDGKGGPGYTIRDEFSEYPHVPGTVSMANKGRADTGGSQFFIVHGDSRHLDGRHTVFGRVIGGQEVVDAVTKLEIDKYGRYGPTDRPYPVEARVVSIRVEPADDGAAASAATPAAPTS